MLSGYLMTEHEFKELDKQHKRDGESGTWGGFDVNAPRGDWIFRKLEDLFTKPESSSDRRRLDLGKQLEVGSAAAFKIWKLCPVMRWISRALAVTAIIGLLWFIYANRNEPLRIFEGVTVGGLTAFTALLILGMMFPVLGWLKPQDAVRGYFRKAVVAVAGFVLTNIHLLIFDYMFLKRGKLERLLRL